MANVVGDEKWQAFMLELVRERFSSPTQERVSRDSQPADGSSLRLVHAEEQAS